MAFSKNKKIKYQPVKTSDFNINPGLTSILLIFTTLCLICFAALNYLSANSDKKLNDRVITRTTEYYDACNRAQEVINIIDDELLQAYKNSNNSTEYYNLIGGKTRNFLVNVNENQDLYVEIELIYPESSSDHFYSIKYWYVKNIENTATIIDD